jgi:protein-S-isoprenylcysteine O-methyltransferase Ste14
MNGTVLKEKNGEHPYGDTGQLLLLVVFLLVWIFDSYFWHKSTFPSNFVPIYIRLIISAPVIAASVFLFKSSHSIADHEHRPNGVVSTGIFHYVRHPLYLAGILFYLGLVIFTLSLLSFLLFGLIFFFYNFISGYEEKLLEAKFGEDYIRYKNRTGKWVPKIIGGN